MDCSVNGNRFVNSYNLGPGAINFPSIHRIKLEKKKYLKLDIAMPNQLTNLTI